MSHLNIAFDRYTVPL